MNSLSNGMKDEDLLELMPNQSWKLLESMMTQRGYEIHTSTAQMQVVGKRHYGLKALPHGSGGGRQTIRELFETLLYWNPKIVLDKNGEADVEIPLNDSLTGFRIAAIAFAGKDFFSEGETIIRTTQDLMIISGIPPVIREGDSFKANFTVRNASDRDMKTRITGSLKTDTSGQTLEEIIENLSAGEAKDAGWDIIVQSNANKIQHEIKASEIKDSLSENINNASDTLKVTQKIKVD